MDKAAAVWCPKVEKKKNRLDRKKIALRTHGSKISDMRCHCGHLGIWSLGDGLPPVPQRTMPLPGLLHSTANVITSISVVLFSLNKTESQQAKDSLFRHFYVTFSILRLAMIY